MVYYIEYNHSKKFYGLWSDQGNRSARKLIRWEVCGNLQCPDGNVYYIEGKSWDNPSTALVKQLKHEGFELTIL